MGDYRKLHVWRRARVFSYEIVKLVDRLSLRDRIRVGSQLSRAAESIRFNIVEGCGLNTDPLMAVHVRRALGSANEVDDQLEPLRELGSLRSTDLWLIDEVREIRSMLASLLRRLEADIAQKRHTRRKKRKSQAIALRFGPRGTERRIQKRARPSAAPFRFAEDFSC